MALGALPILMAPGWGDDIDKLLGAIAVMHLVGCLLPVRRRGDTAAATGPAVSGNQEPGVR